MKQAGKLRVSGFERGAPSQHEQGNAVYQPSLCLLK